MGALGLQKAVTKVTDRYEGKKSLPAEEELSHHKGLVLIPAHSPKTPGDGETAGMWTPALRGEDGRNLLGLRWSGNLTQAVS